MTLWGNKDSVYADGTIKVNFSTLKVVGTGTTFNTAGLIKAGDIITCGVGQTYGEAIITAVDSATQLSIQDTSNFNSGLTTVFSTAYNITQKPISTLKDSRFDEDEIYGVDTTEQGVANAASGDARKYAPAHAGWVGIQTYIDQHGNLRVKTETLVASSSITGDAADDTQLPDS
tara:strand:- start:33 stop:554 length:522 start_codon:yes stop_codon:yes gene_type:complete